MCVILFFITAVVFRETRDAAFERAVVGESLKSCSAPRAC